MIKEAKTGVYIRTVDGKETEYSFNYFTDLTASKKIAFVNNVVNTIVADSYNSVIIDLIFDFEIISIFTDVDVSEIDESPNQIDAIEDLLAETNIVDIVVNNVKEGLIDELRHSINSNIRYKTGLNVSTVEEALAKLINTFESIIKGIDANELMEVAKKINENTGALTPERLLEAYANTGYLDDKIAHDIEKIEKEKELSKVIKPMIQDHKKKAGK